MAFEDAALERAIRAETKSGVTVFGDCEKLTVIGNDWMAEMPMHVLFNCCRSTLGALVEMLGKLPNDGVAVTILRQKDEDTGEKLYRRAFRPREDTHTAAEIERWRHLEAVAWCDREKTDADEPDGT